MSSIIGRLSNLARGALLGGDDDKVADPAVEAELAAATARPEGAAMGARLRSRAGRAAVEVAPAGAPPDPSPTDGPPPPRVPRPRTL